MFKRRPARAAFAFCDPLWLSSRQAEGPNQGVNMTIFWRACFLAASCLLLTSCAIYPYETAFSGCDAEAGACYRYCEQFEGSPDYGKCHADCEYEANQCFAAAYDDYRYASVPYGGAYPAYRPSPWYGQYGYWRPGAGYIFSFDYYRGGYGYRAPYSRDQRRNDRRRRRGGNTNSGGQPAQPAPATPPPSGRTPPSSSPPPQAQPPAPPPSSRQPQKRPRTPKDYPNRDEE